MCWTMFSFRPHLSAPHNRCVPLMPPDALAGAQWHSKYFYFFCSSRFRCCCCCWWMGWAEWLNTFSSHSTQWLYVYVRVGVLRARVWMKADDVQQRQQCSKNENKNWIKCLRSMVWNFCFILYIVCSASLFRRSTSTTPPRRPFPSLHFFAADCGISAAWSLYEMVFHVSFEPLYPITIMKWLIQLATIFALRNNATTNRAEECVVGQCRKSRPFASRTTNKIHIVTATWDQFIDIVELEEIQKRNSTDLQLEAQGISLIRYSWRLIGDNKWSKWINYIVVANPNSHRKSEHSILIACKNVRG